MTQRQIPIVLDTLGKILGNGLCFSAWCQACNRNALLDGKALLDRLGDDWPWNRRMPLKCERCGSADASIRLIQADRGGTGGAHSLPPPKRRESDPHFTIRPGRHRRRRKFRPPLPEPTTDEA